MRPTDKATIIDVVQRIYGATGAPLSREQMMVLLTAVREFAPRRSGLRDLGDSAVHAIRDRYGVHEYLQNLLGELRSAFETRGPTPVVNVAYPIGTVIEELNSVFEAAGIAERLNPRDGFTRKTLAWGIAEVLHGTTIVLDGAVGHMYRRVDERGVPRFELAIEFLEDRVEFGLPNLGGFAVPWLIGDDEAETDWSSVLGDMPRRLDRRGAFGQHLD